MFMHKQNSIKEQHNLEYSLMIINQLFGLILESKHCKKQKMMESELVEELVSFLLWNINVVKRRNHLQGMVG